MPRKKQCKHKVVKGGGFEWRCILEAHEDNRPDSHYFQPYRIAPKTST